MLKRNWSLTGVSLAAIIFYAVCGLLLLLLPTEALAIANYAIAALLLVMGVVCIIGYFRGSVIIGQFGFLLAVGMVLVTLAVVMFCYPTLLASLLPARGAAEGRNPYRDQKRDNASRPQGGERSESLQGGWREKHD